MIGRTAVIAVLLLSAFLPASRSMSSDELFDINASAGGLQGAGQRRPARVGPRRFLQGMLDKFNTGGTTSNVQQQQQQQQAAAQLSGAQAAAVTEPTPTALGQANAAQAALATLPTQQATSTPTATPTPTSTATPTPTSTPAVTPSPASTSTPTTTTPQPEQRTQLVAEPAKQPPPPPPVASSPPPPPPVASSPPPPPPVASSPPPPPPVASSPPPPPPPVANSPPPPPPPVATPPPPPPKAAGGCPDSQAALDDMNSVRASYNAGPLSWSSSLASSAQAWADQCVFQHSSGDYGETLMKGGALSLSYTSTPCTQSVNGWAGEATNWPGGNDMVVDAGHFTQLVWKGTAQVGCGYSDCGGDSFVVCRYFPPGNVAGAFAANVG